MSSVRRVGISALEERLGVDRSTVQRWYSAGKFPQPHYVGTKRAWFLHDVELWEATQMARTVDERWLPGTIKTAKATAPESEGG